MGKITLKTLDKMKADGEKIACLTAYDYTFARILDTQGVDIQLVGDSLGMVLHGKTTTLNVSMADMIYHTRLVADGCHRSLIVADMPFMSYASPARALGNAERLLREGGAEVVKLEGGAIISGTVNHLSARGIPVCAHLGLTPQSVHKLGGYHVQGRNEPGAATIQRDAMALADAGAVMLVLECVPAKLAMEISRSLSIPVIGIGAGNQCDGQVLVLYDVLGMGERQPRFSHNFLTGHDSITSAIKAYVDAVKSGVFPAEEHSF